MAKVVYMDGVVKLTERKAGYMLELDKRRSFTFERAESLQAAAKALNRHLGLPVEAATEMEAPTLSNGKDRLANAAPGAILGGEA